MMQSDNPFKNYDFGLFLAAFKTNVPLNGWLVTKIEATQAGSTNDSTVEGNDIITIIKENQRGQMVKVTLQFEGL